jgi:alpha-glucosidase (family GH31 glycosyl hydrolase)
MKPEAASMEPRYWTQAFHDSDKGRAQMEDLKNACDWLHAHGMKAMVYIAVGAVDGSAVGFQEEYLVHADLTLTQPDGTVEVQKNIVDIPWVGGVGANPDAVCGADGKFITFKYLDVTNEEACEWYFDRIWGKMIEIGVDGVKIDFCEELANEGVPFGKCKLNYHWKNPEKLAGSTVHHAYPVYYISAFYKRMIEHKAAKGLTDGFMVFSRGGGIGSQRNPYMWAGDQCRTFDKLSDQLMAVVNSGLSGIPFMSFDMGGYHYYRENYHTTDYALENELFSRAVAFTSFFTQMQTHGDVRHAYEMNEQTKQIYRNFTRLHTDLIPHIQKYSKIACETGMPPVRHLVLKYPNDVNVYGCNDEFMLGDGLLVAPILTQGTTEREVYLPAGNWTELLTGKALTGGTTVTAHANLGQIPAYLNNDSEDAADLAPIFEGRNWRVIQEYDPSR